MFGIPMILIVVVAILVLLMLVGAVLATNWIKVPSDEVAEFAGSGKKKLVTGAGHLRIPGFVVVNRMSLRPHEADVDVRGVFSKDGTPINLTGVGVIGYGRDEEALGTAVGLYLRTPRGELDRQVQKVLAGVVRSVVSSMTVEQLNTEKIMVSTAIQDAAKEAFSPNGMVINTFTIENLTDDNGYLEALGAPRNAAVKMEAQIAKADAERETAVRQAQADIASAQARKDRDIELAAIQEEVDRRKAQAAQAGPLAEATAQAAVEVARADAARQQEEASIQVEKQRALRAEAAQQADVIIPAEARRQASVIEAQGKRDAAVHVADADKQTTIARAQAEAEQRRLSSSAEAEAVTVLAAADQTKKEAEAAGEGAMLSAQANGQKELAAAYNSLDEAAGRLQVLPKLIEALPAIVRSVADGVQIDRMVVMDGGAGNGNGSGLERAAGVAPAVLNQVHEMMQAFGLDVTGMFNKAGIKVENGSAPAAPASSGPDETTPAEPGDGGVATQ